MVLEGRTTAADGKLTKDRINWTPNADGSVRQLWESTNPTGGWIVTFDGSYTRRQQAWTRFGIEHRICLDCRLGRLAHDHLSDWSTVCNRFGVKKIEHLFGQLRVAALSSRPLKRLSRFIGGRSTRDIATVAGGML